jgi:hypothetical protein
VDNESLSLNNFTNPALDANVAYQVKIHPSDSLLAVHFPCWEETGKERSGSILVIRDKGEYWERVTLLDDDDQLLKHAEKTRKKVRLG